MESQEVEPLSEGVDPIHRTQLYISLSTWRAAKKAAKTLGLRSASLFVERAIERELDRLARAEARRSA